MRTVYETLMNAEKNPLRHMPREQALQIMVYLSAMWTAIFCTAAGLWYLYGEILVVHILLALGIALTGLTFERSRQGALATYRDQPRKDGTARYDDVWGA